MVCFGRPYHFRFFKGCHPQVLLGPFVNTLSHLFILGRYLDYQLFFLAPQPICSQYTLSLRPENIRNPYGREGLNLRG